MLRPQLTVLATCTEKLIASVFPFSGRKPHTLAFVTSRLKDTVIVGKYVIHLLKAVQKMC